MSRPHAWLVIAMVALMLVSAAPQAASQAAPAAAPTTQTFAQKDLDALLAPIALYPDALLAQVLMSSTYPLEVVSAERWSKANASLKGAALEDALARQTWDPSVKALVAVPAVLTMMSEKIDWTQRLGDAYLAQPKDVMATVQTLRAKAVTAGSLKTTSQQKVVVAGSGTAMVVTIVQVDPQVVYVPVYDPTVVYGTWWWAGYPPYQYYPPAYVRTPGLWFAAGVAVGAALWGQPDWRYGRIDIDIHRYNTFNRTQITVNRWEHNPSHRGAVPYANPQLSQRYSAPARSARGPDGPAVARQGPEPSAPMNARPMGRDAPGDKPGPDGRGGDPAGPANRR